ncbi:MAG: hypothetical protein N2544_05350 [Burkholderiales bacterium]|nr:hypothetical protein [Burkholderiales bacterium]
MPKRLLVATLAICLSGASLGASAQGAGNANDWRWSYWAAGSNVFRSDLEGGGSSGSAGLFTGIAGVKPIDAKLTVSTSVSFNLLDFSFRDPVAFGGVAPWNRVYQPGVSVGVSYLLDSGWRLGFVPTVQYSGESGADFGKSIVWGALASAAKSFSKELTLGLGVAGFSQIEKNTFFPYLIVDWRITEKLRLANPFAPGPAGPAGLELVYDLGSGWQAGLGGAVRVFRFRNSESAPTPDSIGQVRYVPLFASLSRSFTPQVKLELLAGMAVGNEVKLYNRDGDRLVKEEQDPAPFVALTLSGRF